MSFCIELFYAVTLQYQMSVRIPTAYFIVDKRKNTPQPWQGHCTAILFNSLQLKMWYNIRTEKLKQQKTVTGQETVSGLGGIL